MNSKNSGFLRVVSREQLMQQERESIDADQQARQPIVSALSAHVSKRWSQAKHSRSSIDARLLECQRRRAGVYSEAKLAEIKAAGLPLIYMRITGIKCSTAAAWLSDVMQQPGEDSWSIEPTPIPDTEERLDQMLKTVIMQAAQQGQQMTQDDVVALRESATAEITAQLQDATEKMRDIIRDQLVEGEFDNALTDFIDDICTYPAAFMKSVMRTRSVSKWIKQGESWVEQVTQELKPEWDRVSPFDIYPAPEAVNINDSWLIERHRLSRSELRRFIGVQGYDPDAIKAVLREFSEGGIQDIISTDTQRRKIEAAAGSNSNVLNDETIEAIELWDSIPGSKLISWDGGRGLLGKDINPLAEYNVNAWLIGTHVIRVVIADGASSANRGYYKASWERMPGSFWGAALPEIMADIQDACNAIARSLLKNLSISAGPQVVIHVDRLPPGTDIKEIYPLQIHQVTGAGSAGSPIEFFQPSSNAAELLGVYDRFEEKADIYTGIPRYTYGSPDVKGAGQTASGLSMLMSAASKGIKRVVGHIDRQLIEPVIKRQYHDNMLSHPDLAAKVDANILAIGAKSLIIKEQMQQKRTEFMNATLNPVDMQIIGTEGRAKLLRSTATALDLPADLIPENIQQMQQPQEQPQQ